MEAIRAFLTDRLVEGGLSEGLVTSIKTMRVATMEGLDALERWDGWRHQWEGRALDDDYARAADAAVEDKKASVALFRLTMIKVMREVADAHQLTFEAQ